MNVPQTLSQFFSNDGFMAHGHCYLWNPTLIAVMALSDSLIGLAYIWISINLYRIIVRIKLPFRQLFWVACLFIGASASTHFIEVYNLWVPHYWLAGGMKVLTAITSVLAALLLARMMPKIFAYTKAAEEAQRDQQALDLVFKKMMVDQDTFRTIYIRNFAYPLILAGLLAVSFAGLIIYLINANQLTARYDLEIAKSYEVLKELIDGETGVRGFLITNDAAFLQPFQEATEKLKLNLPELANGLSNSHDDDIIDIISRKYAAWQASALDLIETKRNQSQHDFRAILQQQKDRMDELRGIFSDLTSLQVRERDQRAHSSNLLTIVFTIALILLTFIFGFLMTYFAKYQSELVSKNYASALKTMQRSNAELEELVTARTNLLSAANQELESFSYSVSHDLRAPLRAINGFSQALIEDAKNLSSECQEHVNRIVHASKKMGLLIDSLLNFSRLVRTDLIKTEIDLSEMATEIIASLREAAPTREVEVEIEPHLKAFGDQRLIYSALQNLIENAWKFTGQTDNAYIKFGTLVQNGVTTFYVRDNGVGFDMSYVNKLFGAFQRLHNETAFAGTGIGLATVRRIIRRHGGQTWAEGQVDGGATFYFTLDSIESRIWK
jgi:signal transduction histidine kinase